MPITALYAGLLTFLFLALTFRVIGLRRAGRVDLGDGADPLLRRRIRGHGNFSEYAPLGLVLLGLVELGGWPAWLVHALGLMLLAGRVAHGWAFQFVDFVPGPRAAGMALTTGMLGIAAALCLVTAIGG